MSSHRYKHAGSFFFLICSFFPTSLPDRAERKLAPALNQPGCADVQDRVMLSRCLAGSLISFYKYLIIPSVALFLSPSIVLFPTIELVDPLAIK